MMDLAAIEKMESYLSVKLKVNSRGYVAKNQHSISVNSKKEIIEIHLKGLNGEVHKDFLNTVPPSVKFISFENCSGLSNLDFSVVSQIETIYITYCNLGEINQSILALPNLTTLYMFGSPLNIIPIAVFNIKKIAVLFITGSKCDIEDGLIRKGSLLSSVHLNNNEIKKLPDNFSHLRLISLDISSNRLTSFPDVLIGMTSLQQLYLSRNSIKSIPNTINKLVNLKWLWLNDCKLEGLPDELKDLKLERLWIAENGIRTLPEIVFDINTLEDLRYSDNGCSALPDKFQQLSNLKELHLHDNELTEIPKTIFGLNKLKALSLNGNKLSSIPEEILALKIPTISLQPFQHGDIVSLGNNPIASPPMSIIEKGRSEIAKYFSDLKEQGEDYIYEAKLIVVGEPFAGKTTLIQKLLNPASQLDQQQPMTKGIKVNTWHFPIPADAFPGRAVPADFKVNTWDFGGQDIMHSTHRYFLTERSIYVLLADNRKEDTDFYYWLYLIELFSGNSPVVIVLNEKYQYKKFVPEYIIEQFPNILKVVNVNLADNSGLEDLTMLLKKQLLGLPHVGTEPLPRKWVSVRNMLEEESTKKDYVSLQEFIAICRRAGIDKEEQAIRISQFLHDLGTILHFQKDLYLRNIVILRTEWATEAVYLTLFDKRIIENGGRFTHADLMRIWAAPDYNSKHAELLALMKNFELCYQVAGGPGYIIPELLPQQPEHYEWDAKNNLFFEYRYKVFMPKGILTRFIVRVHSNIKGNLNWKNGVVLEYDNTQAEVIERWFERRITIRIKGSNKKGLLAIIQHAFENIHSLFKNLGVDEMIPCNCDECKAADSPHFYPYKKLLNFRDKGKRTVECDRSAEDVDLDSLINDVITAREPGKNGFTTGPANQRKTIKVFLASAGSLSEERIRIETEISRMNDELNKIDTYIELKIWEKESLAFAHGRKQDDFNKLVCESDMFFCLVYDKVGIFTLEEFNLAVERFLNNESPYHINIYFKDEQISTSKLTPSFMDVIALKERIKKEEQIYSEYTNIDQLILKITKEIKLFLAKH